MLIDSFAPTVAGNLFTICTPGLSAAFAAGNARLSSGRAGSGHELPTASVDTSVRRLQHFLAQNATQGRHAVVAVDEAHLLLDSIGLETVRLLLNFDRAGRPALTLLLLGTPALLTGLEQRCDRSISAAVLSVYYGR